MLTLFWVARRRFEIQCKPCMGNKRGQLRAKTATERVVPWLVRPVIDPKRRKPSLTRVGQGLFRP